MHNTIIYKNKYIKQDQVNFMKIKLKNARYF